MSADFSPQALLAGAGEPLELARHCGFFVGIDRVERGDSHCASGQMYVECLIPTRLRHPLPLVMIHGGGGQGLDYLFTPDGREGWAHWFVRRGYAVYVVDRPGHGRAPYHPDLLGPMSGAPTYEFMSSMFTAPAAANKWPQARLHTQWPGSGQVGDPTLDQFMAGGGPAIASFRDSHAAAAKAGRALLEAIGPAVLMTHSAGGPCGWTIADAKPDKVRGIVAIEPLGPPFLERADGRFDWGLAAAPLTYDPPVAEPGELRTEPRAAPGPGLADCLVQAEPARKLVNLSKVPVLVVTAEASWMSRDNHGIVDYLRQAGVTTEHWRLEAHGIHGNGHAMMLEKNSDRIAALLETWIRAAS
ncbi:MAG TPA: alpha/beta hydrolase [Burkholderiaceae bacterium]|nr:alpha/beta hydrolase [Burkholderiaceae bacterium]